MNAENDFWEIQRIWPESTVFIIGGGRSLLKQDLSLIHNHKVIGVNYAYTLGSWVDICWYGDKEWHDLEREKVESYSGLVITCAPFDSSLPDRIKRVGRSKIDGIESEKRTHVAWCGNSGASAINLAYWLGAKTVVLLGFDMQYAEKELDHWHDFYPIFKNRRGKLYNPYAGFLSRFPAIKKEADEIGLRIINATPGGALETFERKPLEEICQDLSAHTL